jgi:broad specificity phosphatase PhoE
VELTLVRHGESEANFAGTWQGQSDSQLSERGRAQADALLGRFAADAFDVVIASDLSRASETARRMLGPRAERIVFDRSWREIDVGAWEGLTRTEVATRFPEQIAALAQGSLEQKVGGGESWGDLRRRVSGALERLLAEHRGRRVAVVSHGGVILTMLATVLELDWNVRRRMSTVANTAVTTIDFSGTEPAIACFNDTSHTDGFDPAGPDARPLLWLLALAGDDRRGIARVRERFGTFSDLVSEHDVHDLCESLVSSGGTRRTGLLDRAGIDALANGTPPLRSAGASRPEAVQAVVADLLGLARSRVRSPSSGSLTRLSIGEGRVALREYHVTTHLD